MQFIRHDLLCGQDEFLLVLVERELEWVPYLAPPILVQGVEERRFVQTLYIYVLDAVPFPVK